MTGKSEAPPDATLLRVHNTRKPDQVVSVAMDPSSGQLQTQGLHELFGIKEIRFETRDIVENLQEIAQILSFLLESMSEAEDLGLPYGYGDEFEFFGIPYTLYEEGDVRVLRRGDG